jgi:SAM-dependent methyltransferase
MTAESATAPSAKRDVARAGSLSSFMAARNPAWHSQWAWDHYEETIVALAQHFGLKRVCEIGGGRDPAFSAAEAQGHGFDLIVNDIDPGELELTPAGLETVCFDITGDLGKTGCQPGSYDLMISRMVFEHLPDVRTAWQNIHGLLAPGGVALAFFPTLWAPVFTLNHILPETASRALVHALFPARRDGGGDPKFPAIYDWCRGNPDVLKPMLQDSGFRDIHIQPFWGHGYLERVPVLKQIDHAFNWLAAKTNTTFFTTHAYAMVRKPLD